MLWQNVIPGGGVPRRGDGGFIVIVSEASPRQPVGEISLGKERGDLCPAPGRVPSLQKKSGEEGAGVGPYGAIFLLICLLFPPMLCIVHSGVPDPRREIGQDSTQDGLHLDEVSWRQGLASQGSGFSQTLPRGTPLFMLPLGHECN